MNLARRKVLFSIVFLAILTVSLVGARVLMPSRSMSPETTDSPDTEPIVVEKDLSSNIGLHLRFKHYDENGTLVDTYFKENDLILSNYVNWTGMTLSGRTSIWTMKDDQGQTASLTTEKGHTSNVYIAIGNGSTSPTFDDYKLESETHREQIDNWAITENAGWTAYNLTATASFTFSADYNITEAGWCVYMSDLSDEVFFTRDTFTAQTMGDGDTLSVDIIFEFTGGITNNYGKVIANALYGDDRSEQPVVGEDTDGTTGSTVDITYLWDDDFPWSVEVGTSSSSVNISDYTLGNRIHEDVIAEDGQVIYEKSGSDANITVIGYFTFDADYDIYEIGVTTPASGDHHSIKHDYLICRDVRDTPWSVESGTTISVYVKWIIDQP